MAAAWYIRQHRMPALATWDAFAPGLALGHAIGRVGCFAAGCCYGKPTSHFWGVTFTNPIANLNSYTPLGIPLEPTQLFEAAVELANFFILMWLFKRKKFDGQVLAAYFILYGVARYFLEFIRDDPGRGEVFGGIMTGTQLISIGLVITGGLIWWLKSSPREWFRRTRSGRSAVREKQSSPSGTSAGGAPRLAHDSPRLHASTPNFRDGRRRRQTAGPVSGRASS